MLKSMQMSFRGQTFISKMQRTETPTIVNYTHTHAHKEIQDTHTHTHTNTHANMYKLSVICFLVSSSCIDNIFAR